MKKLMTGNEAIARGVYESGCTVAAAYPGTPSTEILENVAQYKEIYSEWSPNEKVALEVASGASISGARSFAAMKQVGLNVAADPFFTMAYTGVNGGLVIVSADEPGVHSSQNEQDNRWYAPHGRTAMLEPSDSQESKDFVKYAFEISEKYDTPVLIRITTRICHSKGLVELNERKEVDIRDYKKDVEKYVMTPNNAKMRHPIVEKRISDLKEFSNNTPLNRIEWGHKKIGIITNGVAYQYAKEVFGEKASYLKLGFTYPLPDKLIKKFAKVVDKIYIIEENDPYIETHVKSLGIECVGKEFLPICGELTPTIIREALLPVKNSKPYEVDVKTPARPPVMCAGCPHRGLYYTLSKYKNIIATGDIGCYTLGMAPPINVTDTCICMGASVSAGIGFQKASDQGKREDKVFALIGDSTFFHSGITGLVDIVYNKSNITVVILDNRITGMTGHQHNPGTGKTLMGEETQEISIENIVKGVGIKEKNIRIVDPYILEETNNAVKDAYESTEPFVIITKQPCALIKDVQKARENVYCEIDQDNCKKCKACMKIGCPAISFKNGKIVIDKSSCNGCTLCIQTCSFDAIDKVGEINE